MNNSLITVITPCYNVEQYLPNCIDSILAQTYKNLEIWLVDDGSPDHCGEICDEYAARDKRIKVIHKENGGLSDARNVAIDRAHGEWITFIDSDDYVTNDYIETLYKLATKYDCEVAVGSFITYKENKKPDLKGNRYQEEKYAPLKAVEQMFYQNKFDTSAWAKLYHRRLFESGVRYPKGLLYEDLATTYLLMLESNGVAFTNKVIYFYLFRNSSIEGEYNPRKIMSGLTITKLMDAHYDLIKPIENAYRCRKLSLFYHLIIPMPKDADGREAVTEYIRKNRWKVLTDKRARKKARVAALLSYLGFDTVKFIFSFVKKR